jgi:hypothetical protein
MRNIGDLTIVLLMEGVILFNACSDKLFWIRNNLLPNRIPGLLNQAQIVGINANWKYFVNAPHLFDVDIENGSKLIGSVHGIPN